MAVIHPDDFIRASVLRAAEAMANAARTAPKAIGQDLLDLAILTNESIEALAAHMVRMADEGRAGRHFVRDAENLRRASACLLIGTRIVPEPPRDCARCGVKECANNGHFVGSPCVFAVHDLGLAVGSAVALAADLRIDNRVMYSVGAAALELAMLDERVKYAMGIPLSVTGKNPFFDRT